MIKVLKLLNSGRKRIISCYIQQGGTCYLDIIILRRHRMILVFFLMVSPSFFTCLSSFQYMEGWLYFHCFELLSRFSRFRHKVQMLERTNASYIVTTDYYIMPHKLSPSRNNNFYLYIYCTVHLNHFRIYSVFEPFSFIYTVYLNSNVKLLKYRTKNLAYWMLDTEKLRYVFI